VLKRSLFRLLAGIVTVSNRAQMHSENGMMTVFPCCFDAYEEMGYDLVLSI
jgi:hypothetical protein